MKKFLLTTIVVLSVGLAMILIGSILQGITWSTGFDGTSLAEALNNVGYIVAMLSGVVLAGVGVAYAVRGEDKNCPKDKENKEDKK